MRNPFPTSSGQFQVNAFVCLLIRLLTIVKEDVPDVESQPQRIGPQRQIFRVDGSGAGGWLALPLQRRLDPVGQSGTAVAVADLHAPGLAGHRRPVDETRNLLPESQIDQQHYGPARTRNYIHSISIPFFNSIFKIPFLKLHLKIAFENCISIGWAPQLRDVQRRWEGDD